MRRIVLAAAAAVALVSPAAALAADGQTSIIQDDALLVHQGTDVRNRTLDDISRLGADTVRVAVLWRDVAPSATKRKRPKRFDPTNPAAYPAVNWDAYDELVRGAGARGLQVLFTPSSPLPVWGSRCRDRKPSLRRACKPDVKQFGKFVQALGRRYDGTYADENQGGGVLPRVAQWSVWNEPNIPGWLFPQYAKVRGVKVAYAAIMYRALAKKAIKALRRTGHPAAEVLLGETAPLGRTTGALSSRSVAPRIFIRELLCLDSRGRRLRGKAASVRRCRGNLRLSVGGYAHHPYTRGGSQPPTAKGGPTEITIASISRLAKLLDQGARAGRLPRRLPIHYTEHGFQTDPPDRIFGIPEEAQARYINQSDWMAFTNPRVRSVAQYKVVDEPKVASFQTGLRFIDGRAKDAYGAYRLPIWVVRRGGELLVYGQVRPAPDGSVQEVAIQHGDDGDGPFTTVSSVEVASPRGHFTTTVPAQAGTWRLRWTPAGGGASIVSRVAKPAKR